MLFTLFGQLAISDRETNSHHDENDLHSPHQDIYNPGTPVLEPDPNHYVDSKDPLVLSKVSMNGGKFC